MRNTIRQVFHSPRFVIGFSIFVMILLVMLFYPLFNPGSPLEMIGVGTFAKPGTYVSLYDTVGAKTETFRLPDAEDNRIRKLLSDADRISMLDWFDTMGIDTSSISDISDTDALIDLWLANYDPSIKPKGMTMAKRNYYKRLNNSILEIRASDKLYVADLNEETKQLEEIRQSE